MPIQPCSDGSNPGFKWGDSGKCYIYTPNDDKSRIEARKKALAQGIAIGDIDTKTVNKEINAIQSSQMNSGIKNPEQGVPRKKKKRKKREFVDEYNLDNVFKSLKEWFREEWVDLSRPKSGGGFEPCGRSDADKGKYPKCVPASRAARMSQAEIDSAIRRKRRAESTERREDKKPIYVSTEKAEQTNVPTNPALYARVKAEAKKKFDVYPSAYANAWLVREYKRRGGGYRSVMKSSGVYKVAEDLAEEEAALAEALVRIAEKYGKFNEDDTGIWAGYDSAEENDDAEIGVKCSNCVLYVGDGVCKIIEQQVEDEGKCRFAVIPDGLVMPKEDEEEEEEEEEGETDSLESLISLIQTLLNKEK